MVIEIYYRIGMMTFDIIIKKNDINRCRREGQDKEGKKER